jgi:Type I phosphodiesterase / nucleotide pyrophosphatase
MAASKLPRLAGLLLVLSAISVDCLAAPKVVVISLDGATPRIVEKYLESGVLSKHRGLGLLAHRGFTAKRNFAALPTLTAPGHISIATGSTAPNNDIQANTFHLLASPFTFNISGFGGPIGGYSLDPLGPAADATAQPMWVALRAAGKKVVTATFPGGDGIDVRVPGLTNSPVIQPSAVRTVDYTVPFGEFGGQGAVGFTLTAADFSAAPALTTAQLMAAGKVSFSPILQKTTALETFTITGMTYTIQVAALDTKNDHVTNYDTLVFFDSEHGIKPGPFSKPATGPAYVKPSRGKSELFYLEDSTRKAGTAFFVSHLAPDLSTVRLARYSVNDIPPVATIQSSIDDINNNVGFWVPQADFRIPEKLSPGFTNFPDLELEAIYEDQVESFVDYQTRIALRAIEKNPSADLLMVYIEQPDGSEHQFLLIDSRQSTNPTDPNSIGAGQDPAKVARYAGYVEKAYQVADRAVQRIMKAVGQDHDGEPKSDMIVVSDHGFDPFHTAVAMNNLLASAGIPSSKARAVTSGPAVNVYISLQGREPNGTVTRDEFKTLQAQIADLLRNYKDTNPNYTKGAASVNVFDKVFTRPLPADINDPSFGRSTGNTNGQDAGDVFAMLTTGYNFDGTQSPAVVRLGEGPTVPQVLSVPNFYGAHGYDPNLENMSAILYAAGPNIGRGVLRVARNIDIAPTVLKMLGVTPASTVDGSVLPILRHSRHERDDHDDEHEHRR